nr:MAG TPA: hypothetical protein [Herelleviridae sp.]
MKLTKSLAELEAAADELLKKSKNAKDDEKASEDTGDVTPEEVSDSGSSTDEDKDIEDENQDEDAVDEKEVALAEEVEDPEDEDVKKSDSDKTDDEEDSDEDDDEEDLTPDEVEKDVKEDFESDELVKKSMENSEFLSSVVDILAKSMSDVQYNVHAGNKAQSAASEILAKSIQAVMTSNKTLKEENERLTRRINKLEKSISAGFEKVMDSLDELASQPAHVRKSMASVSVVDRDFDRSLNGSAVIGGFESLNKSQVLAVLNNELYAGNQNVSPSDIISYESGAPLRQDLQALVVSKCK